MKHLHADTPLTRHVIQEIEAYACYPEVKLTHPEIRCIVDIGANVGASALLFHERFPTAKIFAYEPCGIAFYLLLENLKDVEHIFCFNSAVSNYDGSAKLYTSVQSSVLSGLTPNHYSDGYENVDVLDAARLPAEADLIKVDTEGHEVPIVEAIAQRGPDGPKLLYVEYHAAADRLVLDELLAPNYHLVRGKITDADRGELTYARKDQIVYNPGDFPTPLKEA